MSNEPAKITQEIPVKTTVSPTLHPDAIAPLGKVLAPEGGNAPTAPAYKAGRNALNVLYQGLGDLESANTLTRQKFGTGQVVDGASIRGVLPDDVAATLAAQMGQKFSTVARQFDAGLVQVNETLERLRTAVDKALENPKRDNMAATEASDIRHYVHRLGDSAKRREFLFAACETKEVDVVAACLASPWVAGLSKLDVTAVRDAAEKSFAPEARATLDAATALKTHLTKASTVFVQRYKQIVPHVRESAQAASIKKLKEA